MEEVKSGELLSQLHPELRALVASHPHLPVEVILFRGRLVARQVILNGVKVGNYEDPHKRSPWQLTLTPGQTVLGSPVWNGPKGEMRILASLEEVRASVSAGRVLSCALQPVPEKKAPTQAVVRIRVR